MPGCIHGGSKSWRMEMLLFINSQRGRPRGCPGEEVRGPHLGWTLSSWCFPLTCSSQVRHQRQHLVRVCRAHILLPSVSSISHSTRGHQGQGPLLVLFFNLLKFSWFTMLCSFFPIDQSDSVIHMCSFHILSHGGLSQGFESSSLCSAVGPIVYPFYIY